MGQKLNPRHAVYVGSFDPLTLGHEDLILRGVEIFEQVTVGIGINPDKAALFNPEERLQMIGQVLSDVPNVQVECFEGLAVRFVKDCGAAVMLRGVRTLTDIESEFTMSLANRVLDPDIETVFLMASEGYTHISSSLIKQIAQLGQQASAEMLKDFVPELFIEPLIEKMQKR